MIFDYKASCISRIGKIRNDNEDNFLFEGEILPSENEGMSSAICSEGTTEKPNIFAVMDGMGGELGGEIAAHTAAKTLLEKSGKLSGKTEKRKAFLKETLAEMNESVHKKSVELKFSRSGTTAAILYLENDRIYICNLGDSRIYRFDSGKLEQLSEDDVFYNPNVKNQCLTQFLGIDTEQYSVNPHIKKGEISGGDIFLLCTDGLYNAVSEDEIGRIIKAGNKDLAKCAEKLADTAEENGSDDNCTVVLVKILKKPFWKRIFSK